VRRASLYVFGTLEYRLAVPISRSDDCALRYAPSDLLLRCNLDNPFRQRGQTRLHAALKQLIIKTYLDEIS
jgi:hypothetical protein